MTGDCFRQAALFLMDLAMLGSVDGYTVVHADVERYIDGLRHVHAWVEYDIGGTVLCIDCSTGQRGVFDRNTYYRAGNVGRVVRYEWGELRRLMLTHKHFGPWDAALSAVQDRAVRMTEENDGIRSDQLQPE